MGRINWFRGALHGMLWASVLIFAVGVNRRDDDSHRMAAQDVGWFSALIAAAGLACSWRPKDLMA